MTFYYILALLTYRVVLLLFFDVLALVHFILCTSAYLLETPVEVRLIIRYVLAHASARNNPLEMQTVTASPEIPAHPLHPILTPTPRRGTLLSFPRGAVSSWH